MNIQDEICKQIREGIEMARAEGVKCAMPREFTIEYEDGRKERYLCGGVEENKRR